MKTATPKRKRAPIPRTITLEVDLIQDAHYPDYYGLTLNTDEGAGQRITQGKASGSWRILRKWTVEFPLKELEKAIAFSKKKTKQRKKQQEDIRKKADQWRTSTTEN